MASSNPHHLPKIPLHIPAHPLRGPGFPHMNSRGIQRLSPQQAHTVSAGGVDLGRLEVKEERQGWGLPGRASLEPSADPYLLAVTPDCGCAPPVIPPSQPRYTPTPTRVIRSKPGRDTTSASQGRLSCKTPGTQPRHWLGHHTHTLSGIPGRVLSRGQARCGSLGRSDHTPGAGHQGPRREILDVSGKGGDPGTASQSWSSHMTLCRLETLIWEQPGDPHHLSPTWRPPPSEPHMETPSSESHLETLII